MDTEAVAPATAQRKRADYDYSGWVDLRAVMEFHGIKSATTVRAYVRKGLIPEPTKLSPRLHRYWGPALKRGNVSEAATEAAT
jgi:hypothetical protein